MARHPLDHLLDSEHKKLFPGTTLSPRTLPARVAALFQVIPSISVIDIGLD